MNTTQAILPRTEALLYRLIGLDIESIGRTSLARALRQRINAHQCSPEDYWQQLSQSAAEQQRLVEAMVVPETWFFRYPESFNCLVQLAREQLLALAGSRALRIISLPCSTGEEPYSIAMALLDAGLDAALWQIHALDISEQALAKARLGRYGSNAFRHGDLRYRDRYFSPAAGTGNSYQLADRICAQVQFRTGNLLAMEPATTHYDLVFCRNLLIYFDRPTQMRALAQLQQLLTPSGYLFAGPAEAGLLSQQGMQALDYPQSFAFSRRPAQANAGPTTAQVSVPQARAIAPAKSALQTAQPAAPTSAATTPKHPVKPNPPAAASLASTVATQTIPATTGTASASLARITELANAGRQREALDACSLHLQQQGSSAELFYWWGLVWDGTGDAEEAERYYRKALYLEPNHTGSLAHLAMLKAAQGDSRSAALLQQRLSRSQTGGLNHGQ